MKIYPYSDNQQHRICVRGDNVSSVIDKMVRVTAKITEHYASDIVLWCDKLNDAIRTHNTMACILNFRESGVDLYERAQLEFPGTLSSILSGGIQQWMLTVNWEDDIPVTDFHRIRISV